jgi:hypothetical protein
MAFIHSASAIEQSHSNRRDNRLRTDGLRWIPKANGEFRIPVVSIRTLGDLFVPFSMEQVYQTSARMPSTQVRRYRLRKRLRRTGS